MGYTEGMESVLVPVRIRGIVVNKEDAEALIVLEDAIRGRRVAVPVGPAEARSVIMELEGISPLRPLTHDLIVAMFHDHGLKFERAELDLRRDGPMECDGSFRACIIYRKGLKRWQRDVRPSDALAIALKLKGDIAVTQAVFESPKLSTDALAIQGIDHRCLFLEARTAPFVQLRP